MKPENFNIKDYRQRLHHLVLANQKSKFLQEDEIKHLDELIEKLSSLHNTILKFTDAIGLQDYFLRWFGSGTIYDLKGALEEFQTVFNQIERIKIRMEESLTLNRDMQLKLEATINETSNLLQAIENLQSSNQKQLMQITILEKKIDHITEDNKQLKEDNRQFKEDNKELKASNEKLQRIVKSLYNKFDAFLDKTAGEKSCLNSFTESSRSF